MFAFGQRRLAGVPGSPYIPYMRRFSLPIVSALLLLACDSEGTQIGNEGVIDPAELTDPARCTEKDFTGETTVVGWSLNLQETADALVAKLADAQLDTGDDLIDGQLQPTVLRFHMVDGDCDNLYIETELQPAFGDVLSGTVRGDVLVPLADPSFAEGELLGDDWAGSLLPAPEADRTLVFDASLSLEGSSIDVLIETCDGDACEDTSFATITPVL